ncbi:MAG: hypothetical protein LC804_10970 [Acidobacteria bacterium]|nr:hypothetical protein [Acidobacteriota bacterium]
MKKNLAKSSLILLCFSMAGRRLPFDYSTRYGSTPAEFLDSGSCGYHRFHHSVAVADMEGIKVRRRRGVTMMLEITRRVTAKYGRETSVLVC